MSTSDSVLIIVEDQRNLSLGHNCRRDMGDQLLGYVRLEYIRWLARVLLMQVRDYE